MLQVLTKHFVRHFEMFIHFILRLNLQCIVGVVEKTCSSSKARRYLAKKFELSEETRNDVTTSYDFSGNKKPKNVLSLLL